MKKLRYCSVCGRSGFGHQIVYAKKLSMFLCKKHWHQNDRLGKFLDNNPRTIQDPNEIIIYEEYAEIVLYNSQSIETYRATIDINNIDKIKNIKWCFNGTHCIGDTNHGGIMLHRLIKGVEDEKIFVDHIDRNPLNNRESNLRICTSQENSYNMSLPKNNTSGIIGVCWDKDREKFAASISPNRVKKHLGRYENFDDAVAARLRAEKEYFGEFAPQKHLFEKYDI